MEKITIKELERNEIELLQNIARITFVESFGNQNTDADMYHYLNQNLSLETLNSEFEKENSKFYIVYNQSVIIGYLKLNFDIDFSHEHQKGIIELERIYLLQSHQGQGFGQQLLDFVFEIAQAQKATKIWLGVWENNFGAIRFYERNGFQKVGEHVFLLGSDPQIDWLMEKEIDSNN